MYRDDFAKLAKDELIALVLSQTVRIAALTERIAELEAKLGQPPKTPDNSSVPPSQGRKPNRAERRAVTKRKGRPGALRALAADPDRIVESLAECCPHCAHELSPADQPGFHASDHLELAALRPTVTRIHRRRGIRPHCRRGFSAAPPAGMPPGAPFGPDLTALIVHLHVTLSNGTQLRPRIGIQKGPLLRWSRLVPVANRRAPRVSRSALTSDGAAHVGGACLPTGASRGGTAAQARCLKRQLSLPVSMISQ